jgi:phytoene desaturase (3,4-didehydrolycopene-forming)
LLLLPKLFRETFYDLDTSLEAEGVELMQCPANYNVWFSDGEVFEMSTDLARMKAQIERWEGKDGFSRYLAWLREAHQHYELSVTDVLHKNFTRWWDIMNPGFVITGLRIHPLHTIWNRACRYFWTERLRRVFTFATMYMGMSPFDAPGTYSLLQYTELAEGVWYPKGGFHTVLQALVDVGERLGVEYRFNAPVQQVIASSDGNTVGGVLLESGQALEADVVVFNADLVYSYSNLFPKTPSTERYSSSLRRRDGSCSSISFYWSLNCKVPELKTHNIFLAEEYRESFDAIFDRQTLPGDPSFYINVPSRIDPSAAPDGCDAVIALVPVGHLLRSKGFRQSDDAGGMPRDQDWSSLIASARSAVLSTICARTGGDPLNKFIVHEMVNDPFTWESKFNLDKGSILGLSHSFFNVLKFRPSTKARAFNNAYFVGASTHPGTGVPIVLAGAKLTTEQILKDCEMEPSWRAHPSHTADQGVPQTRDTAYLDRIQKPGIVWIPSTLLTIILCLLFGIVWTSFVELL